VLIETATAMHINHTRPAMRPHAALKTLLSQVDQIADVVLGTIDRPAAVPCGRDDCEHGWITVAPNTVAKCPDCPPAIRAGLLDDHEPEF